LSFDIMDSCCFLGWLGIDIGKPLNGHVDSKLSLTPVWVKAGLAWIDMDWHGLAWIGMDWHGLALTTLPSKPSSQCAACAWRSQALFVTTLTAKSHSWSSRGGVDYWNTTTRTIGIDLDSLIAASWPCLIQPSYLQHPWHLLEWHCLLDICRLRRHQTSFVQSHWTVYCGTSISLNVPACMAQCLLDMSCTIVQS